MAVVAEAVVRFADEAREDSKGAQLSSRVRGGAQREEGESLRELRG